MGKEQRSHVLVTSGLERLVAGPLGRRMEDLFCAGSTPAQDLRRSAPCRTGEGRARASPARRRGRSVMSSEMQAMGGLWGLEKAARRSEEA